MEKIVFADRINILIKPTNECNLRCIYCFHKDGEYSSPLMDMDTVEKIYSVVFQYYKYIDLTWHGGEPTLAGLAFYEKALELQESYKKKYGNIVTNSIQTNGTILTQEYIDLFKKYNFCIGVSYDGIINPQTRGLTSKVENSMGLLKENDLSVGAITVVSKLNINRLIENYEYMKERGTSVQFNHYIEMNKDNPQTQLIMSVDEYAEKMYEFFLYWINDTSCRININPFTNYILEYLFKVPAICTRASCVRFWMCIEYDGKIVPCDKLFPDKYSYGNVKNLDDIRDVYRSSGFYNIVADSIERRAACMKECEIYEYCEGGCNHSALIEGDMKKNGGFSCSAYKKIFLAIINYFESNGIDINNYCSKIKNPTLVKRIRLQNEK